MTNMNPTEFFTWLFFICAFIIGLGKLLQYGRTLEPGAQTDRAPHAHDDQQRPGDNDGWNEWRQNQQDDEDEHRRKAKEEQDRYWEERSDEEQKEREDDAHQRRDDYLNS